LSHVSEVLVADLSILQAFQSTCQNPKDGLSFLTGEARRKVLTLIKKGSKITLSLKQNKLPLNLSVATQ